MTRIKAPRAGRFVLGVPENPDDLVGFFVGRPSAHCWASVTARPKA